MAKRINADTPKKRKIWTILCLIIVCAIAVALRADIVYRIYPLEFEDEIAFYGEKYAIDEYLICAVIYTESHFDEQAESGKGAIGLMQVMPDTGEWAAGIIGINDYSEDMLKDPETNINIGCWYLGYLTEMFDGDADMVLAAYNAGPSNVQQWTDSNGTLTIEFEETQTYLERVQRYYEIYKGLYDIF
ncbi:MAG: lytic transglycosylase domain-containing protein [Eubacteriales bacterium]|nr:lytic transglycosylase domain-containing protein [Eubacteriales bacterium]